MSREAVIEFVKEKNKGYRSKYIKAQKHRFSRKKKKRYDEYD